MRHRDYLSTEWCDVTGSLIHYREVGCTLSRDDASRDGSGAGPDTLAIGWNGSGAGT